ncbi:sigma-70 family RNA polymerase sigma factor [Chitinophaga pendula]|uniref:sigma-70 family RNA polymerase sigma factor n=1 Tax=Chitinophaga TaxID=79328 RepID=UPI000BB036AE|nr:MULTISPECIES: sigma-70 family RNA polymerase sigma factor [Chitinophaga]ASZ13618.1 hypothetical protein CK934_23030 [Chitinophaga sp. MD30]UCJ08757.1 sigma-70 family RNA polymerase sigma factor [Chitinophaga pendula]
MQQQLTHLSDKELMSRVRRLKDREAEGVLLERYSHLLVAVCLPEINKQPGSNIQQVFPSLLQRLSTGLKTLTINKASDWIYYTIQAQQGHSDKQTPYHPTRESKDLQYLAAQVEKAGSNNIEKQELIRRLHQAMQKLQPEDRQLLEAFYLDNKSFDELASGRQESTDKIRTLLKQAKRKLTVQMMNLSYVK